MLKHALHNSERRYADYTFSLGIVCTQASRSRLCHSWVSQKKFARLVGYGIKSIRLIFKTEMLIYQSKANLDEKTLFGKLTHPVTHHLNSGILEILVKGMFGNEDSTCHSVP